MKKIVNWELIGKSATIFFVIAALITILTGIPQILNWFSPEKPSLDFQGTSYEYQISPSSKKTLKMLNKNYEYIGDEIFNMVLSGNNDTLNKLEASLSKNNRNLENAIDDMEYSGFIWTFIIKNDEEFQVNNVQLELPFIGYYSLVTSTQKSDTSYNYIINIGEIRADSEVKVIVWTSDYAPDSKREYIKLATPNNVFYLEEYKVVTGFTAWIVSNWMLLLFVILLIISIFNIVTTATSSAVTNSDTGNKKG